MKLLKFTTTDENDWYYEFVHTMTTFVDTPEGTKEYKDWKLTVFNERGEPIDVCEDVDDLFIRFATHNDELYKYNPSTHQYYKWNHYGDHWAMLLQQRIKDSFQLINK